MPQRDSSRQPRSATTRRQRDSRIKFLAKSGVPQRLIADYFGVSQSTVWRVIHQPPKRRRRPPTAQHIAIIGEFDRLSDHGAVTRSALRFIAAQLGCSFEEVANQYWRWSAQ